MRHVLLGWEKKYRHNSVISDGIKSLRLSTKSTDLNLDLRQLTSLWVSYLREPETTALRNEVRKGKRRWKRFEQILIENPPENIDNFLDTFRDVEYSDNIDSRTIAMIAGIPNSDSNLF